MEKKIIDKCFDHHVHIGQFYEEYFKPHKVIEVLYNNHINGCWFSSTTSCMTWSNEVEKKYLKNHIKDEINEALFTANKLKFKAYPFYWVNLKEYIEILNKTELLSIKDYLSNEMKQLPYFGIKIHTKLYQWDINDSIIKSIFNSISEYANDNNMPIQIHCGYDKYERPNLFEEWFKKYKNVKFVLAHMKPVDITITMLKKYQNVYADTAFAAKESIESVLNENLTNKVLYGTDYPINKECYKTL